MDEVAAAGAPGPVYAGGRLPGGAVFKAVLLPHPYGGGRDIYLSVHHAPRHTAGPAVRRNPCPARAGAAAAVHRAGVCLGGHPSGLLPPVQGLSHRLLPDKDGHGGPILRRDGGGQRAGQLAPHSDNDGAHPAGSVVPGAADPQ